MTLCVEAWRHSNRKELGYGESQKPTCSGADRIANLLPSRPEGYAQYHLAELYQVEPRALVQAVKRNIKRFPSDFMFILSSQECENLKSQFVISGWGGLRRAAPYAFTEQGVAMLSSVLRSTRAIQVNILSFPLELRARPDLRARCLESQGSGFDRDAARDL